MYHGMKLRKLGRKSQHRLAMFMNMSNSLIEHERIETTLPKAKELRRVVEKLITKGKDGTLSQRRLAFSYLRSDTAVKKLFGDLATRFKDRSGGYTRILKVASPRHGDAATVAVIEFVDYVLPSQKTAEDKKKEKAEGKKQAKAAKAAKPKLEKSAKQKIGKTSRVDAKASIKIVCARDNFAAIFFVLLGTISVSCRASNPDSQIMAPRERQGFYRWLITEMHEDIYQTPVQDAKSIKDVLTWVNVLDQGGSIEGVYHGMILTPKYRALERGRASLAAIRFFAEQLAMLKLEQSTPDENTKKLTQEYGQRLLNMPLYTLKRELGERMFTKITKLKGNQEKLADWFANLTVYLAGKNVPFGMEQRNRADINFHKQWAMNNNLGLLQWETLNRMHRILNYYGKAPTPAAPGKSTATPVGGK